MHFTNFAILLGSGGSSCSQDDPTNTVIMWLSMASLIIAIVAVFVALVTLEMYVRINRNRKTEVRTQIEEIKM